MNVLFSIVSRRAIAAQDTNSISLVDVVEELTALGTIDQAPPNTAIPMEVQFVTLFEAETDEERADADVMAEFWIDTPDGQKLMVTPVTVNFAGNPRYRATLNIQALPLAGIGDYKFNLKCGDAVGTWKFSLKSASEPPTV